MRPKREQRSHDSSQKLVSWASGVKKTNPLTPTGHAPVAFALLCLLPLLWKAIGSQTSKALMERPALEPLPGGPVKDHKGWIYIHRVAYDARPSSGGYMPYAVNECPQPSRTNRGCMTIARTIPQTQLDVLSISDLQSIAGFTLNCMLPYLKEPSVNAWPSMEAHYLRLAQQGHTPCDIKGTYSMPFRYHLSRNRKIVLAVMILFYVVPTTALTLSPPRAALRVASGILASGSAAGVIPLRTIDNVPPVAWIVDYVVWTVSFGVYLTLQLRHIPQNGHGARQLFLFSVMILAIHFSIAAAQGSDTMVEGLTMFGPILLTVSTFLTSLLFSACASFGQGRGDNQAEEGIMLSGLAPMVLGILGL